MTLCSGIPITASPCELHRDLVDRFTRAAACGECIQQAFAARRQWHTRALHNFANDGNSRRSILTDIDKHLRTVGLAREPRGDVARNLCWRAPRSANATGKRDVDRTIIRDRNVRESARALRALLIAPTGSS